jgi:hypothetical protein
MKTRMAGFQKPLNPEKTAPVSLAIVRTVDERSTCSCGQSFEHRREKVREDWIDRHINRKHNGTGVRL